MENDFFFMLRCLYYFLQQQNTRFKQDNVPHSSIHLATNVAAAPNTEGPHTLTSAAISSFTIGGRELS